MNRKDLNRNKDSYPEEGEEITLHGALDLYEEGKHSYAYLKDAVIE
ncbi:MAG: hypothetical protein IKD94_02815 [Erysipelotrichaceae bacterium]|nr:hypothetical protein [Erysipelotrichaceae bacterium]